MILQILKANWKIIAAIIGVALLALIIYGKWVNYGKAKYHSGYLAAVEAQKVKDKEASEQHEQDKKTIEQEAQSRIDAARADAINAAASADRMREETDRIRKLAERYTGTQPASISTRKVIVMLTQLLDESNDSYRRTAEEADRYYNSGLTCQKQYESLIK
jgi:hypothetical protein|nr:MAG TPA: Protein of unknown function (DUF2514) [Caudoviricetes sp.]